MNTTNSGNTVNAASLFLDVYLIPRNPKGSIQTFFTRHNVLIELANLAVQLNTYIQQHYINDNRRGNYGTADIAQRSNPCYRWISGGDGPVFGIHCSCSSSLDASEDANFTKKLPGVYMIPHLRTLCRYSVSVNDEWCLIGLVLDFLDGNTFLADLRSRMEYEVAIECWDIDDGQILLIEGAQSIPQWIDDIGPNHCSHRCWIRSSSTHSTQSDRNRRKWVSQLLRPKDVRYPEPLQLADALQLLANQQLLNDNSVVEYAPDLMEEAILKRIQTSQTELLLSHRAAVVLPESVVRLFHHRPDLISTACQMFVEHIQDPIRVKKVDDYLFGVCENWIWTTIPFSRTAYAMIRTVVSPPEWINEGSIAPSVLATSSLEVKRYQRQCAVEATPHLRYGLQLGVRLLAGLHHCTHVHMRSKPTITTGPHLTSKMSSTERRVLLYWSRIAKQCDIDGSKSDADNWITDAWYAGPNDAAYDLKSFLQCPVFVPEIQSSITPLTYPDTVLSEQIRKELLRPHNDVQLPSNPPHHTEVDAEDWMWILPTSKDAVLSDLTQTPSLPKIVLSKESKTLPEKQEVSALDNMLSGVESFMDGTSTLHGVDSSNKPIYDDSIPIVINPTLFMNILHTALKANSAQELSDKLRAMATHSSILNDPFFSEDDYLLMDPSNDNESDDDEVDNDIDADTMNMEDIMNAMDAELRESTSTSRAWDTVTSSNLDDDIAQNAHILSNLLKSIDASGGGPGPMRNILKEMDDTGEGSS
jgi:SGT1 protein